MLQTIVQQDGLYEAIWQFPVALVPFGHSEGHESVVLRPVDSQEAMTATAHHLPSASLKRMQSAVLGIAGIGTHDRFSFAASVFKFEIYLPARLTLDPQTRCSTTSPRSLRAPSSGSEESTRSRQ